MYKFREAPEDFDVYKAFEDSFQGAVTVDKAK